MLTKRIIPCLDVKAGRVVKGVSFLNLRDAGDPVEAAVGYDHEGADELCFLDITASHENRKTILDVVERTANAQAAPHFVRFPALQGHPGVQSAAGSVRHRSNGHLPRAAASRDSVKTSAWARVHARMIH